MQRGWTDHLANMANDLIGGFNWNFVLFLIEHMGYNFYSCNGEETRNMINNILSCFNIYFPPFLPMKLWVRIFKSNHFHS